MTQRPSRPTASRPSPRGPQRPSRLRGIARPAQMALSAMGGVLLVYAQAVAALGVGEPRYLSHLFEPLQVDIPVDTRGVDAAAVKVGVTLSGADPEMLATVAGQLKREWRVDERGGHVLRVSAPQAIHEPMLQMRVEVGDNRIQAVRDLTLLFDPAPMPAADTAIAAVQAPLLPAAAAVPAVASIDSAAAATADAAEATAALQAIEAELSAEAAPAAEPEVALTVEIVQPKALLSVPARPALPKTAVAAVRPVVASPAPVAATAVAATTPEAPRVATSAAAMPAPRTASARIALATVPALAAAPVTAVQGAIAPIEPVLAAGTAPTAAERQAEIASTFQPRALSAIDRWQRVRVADGDTLESLAATVRGEHTDIPLPMVAMLLRWLNPRSFDGVAGAPRPGAELRFPKAESLAAQIAVSGGVWTVDDVTAASEQPVAAVPPPSFQLLTALSAESLQRSLDAATAPATDDAAAAIAALGATAVTGRPALSASPALRLSGGLVGGAALAGVLSMLLMLNMVVRSPLPSLRQPLQGAVIASRTATELAPAAARVLPGETLDLAGLDLGPAADAIREAARQERKTS